VHLSLGYAFSQVIDGAKALRRVQNTWWNFIYGHYYSLCNHW